MQMFPSRILGAGNSALSTRTITGTGVTNLVATGNSQATALQLSDTINAITTSAASTGLKLPPTEMGMEIWIRNDSGQTITIYPFETSGTTINAGASNITLATAKTLTLKAATANYWMTNLSA
jgi:hypothetical protein